MTAKQRQPRANRAATRSASWPIAVSMRCARVASISSTAKSGGPAGARSAAQKVLRIGGLEAEVQLSDRLDHFFVAARRAAREPLEEGQHRVGGIVEVDQRVAAFEIAALWLSRPSAVLHRGAPLAAPRPVDLDPVGEVLALRRLLVDRVLPEDERERPDQAGCRLVDRGELVAEPVLDVIRVNSVVHDLECAVEAGRYWTRERVIDEKTRPLLWRQVVEDLVELLRILLEAVERLLARELAELESVVVEGLPHHRQAKRRSVFARHRRVPVLEVALHHVDHVADQVACLPAGAARVDVPVLRVGDHPRELFAVWAHDGHHRVLAVSSVSRHATWASGSGVRQAT